MQFISRTLMIAFEMNGLIVRYTLAVSFDEFHLVQLSKRRRFNKKVDNEKINRRINFTLHCILYYILYMCIT